MGLNRRRRPERNDVRRAAALPRPHAARAEMAEALERRTLLSQTFQLPLVNPGFETLYQPGSTSVTATLPVNTATEGFGSNIPVQSLTSLTPVPLRYSDGTTGTNVDIPGWTVIPIQHHPSQQPVAGVIREPVAYGGKPDNFASIFYTPDTTQNSAQIRQTLTGMTLLPNSTYILSADVAEGGSLNLEVGAKILGTGRIGHSAPNAFGFVRITKTYKPRSNVPPGDLTVVLSNGVNSNGDFDNVTLTLISSGATPNPTPTPTPQQFGVVNRHQRNLKLTEPDGTIASLSLAGATGVAIQNGSRIDLQITDLGKGASLGVSASLGSGMVTLGSVTVTGNLTKISGPATNLAGSLSVTGAIGSMTLDTISGTISAASIGKVRAGNTSGVIYSAGSITSLKLGAVSGTIDAAAGIGPVAVSSLTGATILSGAVLGAAGATPVAATAALSYGSGAIASISVNGAVTAGTFVGAGVNPADGVFANGNDTAAGTGQIGAVSIRGAADDTSHFESTTFGLVRIKGKKLNIIGDPRFIII